MFLQDWAWLRQCFFMPVLEEKTSLLEAFTFLHLGYINALVIRKKSGTDHTFLQHEESLANVLARSLIASLAPVIGAVTAKNSWDYLRALSIVNILRNIENS